MKDNMDKLLEEYKKEISEMSEEDRRELFRYKPGKYEKRATDLISPFLEEESACEDDEKEDIDLNHYGLRETMRYISGTLCKEALEKTKKDALTLISKGHKTKDTAHRYNTSEEKAWAFEDRRGVFFVKMSWKRNYFVLFENKDEIDFEKGKIHVREFWEDIEENQEYLDTLKKLNSQIDPTKPDLKLLNRISGLAGMFSDSRDFETVSHRPNLENALGETGLRFGDGRDAGYIGTFKKTRGETMEVQGTYNMNTLGFLTRDLKIALELN